MKIEIGESLALSFLKHTKKCVSYQTNWKISPSWSKHNVDIVEEIYQRITTDELFEGTLGTSSLTQLLKQAEIDVLGQDQHGKVYTVDIAYHSAGLNYGNPDKTKERVLKKLVRTYLILLTYFPNKEYEIIFASPKVHSKTDCLIVSYIDELNKLLRTDHVNFTYIRNEDFVKKLFKPTLELSKNSSDTAELFLRALGLSQLVNFDEVGALKSDNSNEAIKERKRKNKLPIEFVPIDEKQFKQLLLERRRAKRTYYYIDGSVEEEVWHADNLKETSSLRSNIFSTPKMRDREQRGLRKLKLEIED